MERSTGPDPIVEAGEEPIITIDTSRPKKEETVGERLHDFEEWALEEMAAIERMIINHHSAAFIMVAVFILGLLSASMIASEEPPSLNAQMSVGIYLSGYVVNSTGNPLEGATVSVKGSTLEETTNQDGYYYMGFVARGTYEITASAPNHTIGIKRVYLSGEGVQMVNFMLEEGYGSSYEEEAQPSSPPSFWTLSGYLAAFITITSFMSLIGAINAYLGRNFKLTLICAAASTMTYGFIAGTILGFFALMFVMLSKNDFDDVFH